MSNIDIILGRCDKLIEEANGIIERKEDLKVYYITSSIEDILQSVYSGNVPEHLTFEIFLERLPKMIPRPRSAYTLRESYKLSLYLEIFKAFTDDLRGGLINNLSNIISIDIFNDLIEQAIELRRYNAEPLNRAACVLTRIVLQDTLLRLCDINNITLSTDNASGANDELKKNSIYGRAKWREIQSWLDIGNTAAHPDPNFSTITETDIDNMINNVRVFSENYLSQF